MDLCVNDEILELFRLIRDRNILAKERYSKRRRRDYISKILDHKKTNRLTGKHLRTPLSKLRQDLDAASRDYVAARKELSAFTKQNRSIRQDLRRKYKTKQFNSPNNTVKGITIDVLGSKITFRLDDIDRILTDAELNDILLGIK